MTRFINQFDIKYLMVKRIVGRTKINVIDSIPYSQLIFLVASGKSYALSIAEARGKTDSSPTAKQLKQLEARGFLKSQKEKLLNKTVYSVNWEKATNSFIDYVIEKFEECYQQEFEFEGENKDIEKIKKYLKERADKGEIPKEEIGKLRNITMNKMNNKIRDKQFLTDIRKNEYIKVLIKNLFLFSARIKNKTIKQSFDDLRIVLRLDKKIFSGVHHPSPEFDNVTKEQVNEYTKKIFEENKTDIDYKQLIEFIEISNSSLFIGTGVQAVYHLQDYLQHKYSLMCCATSPITEKYLKEEYNQNQFFEIFENNPNLKKLISTQENGFKVTKTTENKHNKSGNTNQNKALSSENKQGESSK